MPPLRKIPWSEATLGDFICRHNHYIAITRIERIPTNHPAVLVNQEIYFWPDEVAWRPLT